MSRNNETKTKLWAALFDWVEAITVALVIVVLIIAFLFRLVSVDGSSMEGTLHNQEQLVLSRLPYTPAYTDIVVINMEDGTEPLIKRIIGLPGDIIEVTAEGQVLRNGEVLEEPYITVPTAQESMTGPVTVPENMVFVMGDNRADNCSLDSRTFGCIPQSALIGKAVFRVTPLDRFGGLYE